MELREYFNMKEILRCFLHFCIQAVVNPIYCLIYEITKGCSQATRWSKCRKLGICRKKNCPKVVVIFCKLGKPLCSVIRRIVKWLKRLYFITFLKTGHPGYCLEIVTQATFWVFEMGDASWTVSLFCKCPDHCTIGKLWHVGWVWNAEYFRYFIEESKLEYRK